MKIKKLNQLGFSHEFLAAFIVVTFAVVGVGYLVSSHADPANPSNVSVNTSSSSVNLSKFTLLGKIPTKSLYIGRLQPPSSESPSMSFYACTVNVSFKTYYLDMFATLSSGVPQSAAGSWYDGIDLSSSNTENNIVSSGSKQYSYQSNGWIENKNNTDTDRSVMTETANFQPDVITSLYVWAEGSYGGSAWSQLSNHPDVTTLKACGNGY
jgi:hypothetical protein